MKYTLPFLAVLCLFQSIAAQDLSGEWNGALSVQGMQLRLVFHLNRTEGGYSATMDSPDQQAFGIPVAQTRFEAPTLTIEMPNLGILFTGVYRDTVIAGTFQQRGMEYPMDLRRKSIEKKAFNRPQEPKEPFPYHAEEVKFRNPDANVTLAGTLTLPKKEGRFPAVVLISGSGPQNRDEELLGHKPFLVLADYLTRKGIAVLRYDDRGYGKSTGTFQIADSRDFAADARSAVAYLKTRQEIDGAKIGLIGHSEGGLVAPMVAAQSDAVAFIVLMAGPGLPGKEILALQSALIDKANGKSDAEVAASDSIFRQLLAIATAEEPLDSVKARMSVFTRLALQKNPALKEAQDVSDEAYVQMTVAQLTSPWFRFFLSYDPATDLEKVKCPVLAINGEKDLQVPAKANLEAIEDALARGGNKKTTVKEFARLNHLFQECTTGSPKEYAVIEQTMSEKVLETVAKWVKEQVR